MYMLISLIAAYFLDFLIGDPFGSFHPICLIGNFISKCEKHLRKIFSQNDKSLLIGGFFLTFFTLCLSFFIPFFILFFAKKINFYLFFILNTIFCYQILAAKSLKDESLKVYKAVKAGDISLSRKYLSYIVGRDTDNLTFEGIIKATVETVAENTTDGVIAPIIFMALGGAPLGFLYKAVNTLDSMVGYKNEKYLFFGRFSAKTDDVFNFIPAILSAYLMILSAFILRFDGKSAYRIYKRDHKNHSSPNSARTESAVAGALGIELLGDACYFGKLVKKKTLGDKTRKVEADDIIKVNKMMYIASFLALISISLMYMVIL